MPTCAVCRKTFMSGERHFCKDGLSSVDIDDFTGDCRKCRFNPCRCNDSDENYEWSAIQDKRRYQTHLSDVEFMKNKIVEAAFGRNVSGTFRMLAKEVADWAIVATNSFEDAVEHVKNHQDMVEKITSDK